MEPIRITSLDDPRLEPYRDVHDAHLRMTSERRPESLFMGEGEVVVRQLVRSPYRIRSILLTPTRLATVGDIVASLEPPTEVYLVEQDLMDGVTGFHIHRGLLAAGIRAPEPALEVLLATPGPLLILEDLANHDNIGGIFRNAAAFGASGVLLSPRCADPLYRKALRVSCGHALMVPFASIDPWPAGLGFVRSSGFVVGGLATSPDGVTIDEAVGSLAGHRVALLLGAEGPGLSAGAVEHCDFTVRIPMREAVDSLNVATACGIALHRFGTTETP